jgi:hypothetical protein
MILEDSIVQGNADIGMALLNSDITILRTLIQGNQISGGGGGGGIRFENGTLTIIDSTIRNNVADQGSNGGGVLVRGGIVDIQGSTISGNSAEQGSGGGIYFSNIYTYEQFLLTNSTVSGNTALLGGGVFINSDVMNLSPTIRYTTIVNNTALSVVGAGGAVFLDPGSKPLAFSRNIVHGNTGSPTCYPSGGWLSGGFNLLQDTSCGNHVTDLVGVDPQLGALEDNGGATHTHALLVNSPAIDAAVCLGTITNDQRGAARPQGASCDSGSYEFGGTLAVVYLPVVLRNP